jgi:hypothetical protein
VANLANLTISLILAEDSVTNLCFASVNTLSQLKQRHQGMSKRVKFATNLSTDRSLQGGAFNQHVYAVAGKHVQMGTFTYKTLTLMFSINISSGPNLYGQTTAQIPHRNRLLRFYRAELNNFG